MLICVSGAFYDEPIVISVRTSLVARKKDQTKIDEWLPMGIT
jgi:hypothetical protein